MLQRIFRFLRLRFDSSREGPKHRRTDGSGEGPIHDLSEPIREQDTQEIPTQDLWRFRETIAIHSPPSPDTVASSPWMGLAMIPSTMMMMIFISIFIFMIIIMVVMIILGIRIFLRLRESGQRDTVPCLHEALDSEKTEEQKQSFVSDPGTEHTVHEDRGGARTPQDRTPVQVEERSAEDRHHHRDPTDLLRFPDSAVRPPILGR